MVDEYQYRVVNPDFTEVSSLLGTSFHDSCHLRKKQDKRLLYYPYAALKHMKCRAVFILM
jgi:hypothetical protein